MTPLREPQSDKYPRSGNLDGQYGTQKDACAAKVSSERDCRIMIVDDVSINIDIVCAHLSSVGYCNFIKVTDSTQAIKILYQEQPDVLLLDLIMPDISGIDVLNTVREDPAIEHLPVLILSACEDTTLKKAALESGATDFLRKPIDAEDLIPRVRNALVLKRYQDTLEQQVQDRTRELEESRIEVVHCLARAAEYRDEDTGNHVIRVGKYVGLLAREIGLGEETARLFELAAILHDVGKIGVSDSVLLKPGQLTNSELDSMRLHCDYGQQICDSTINKHLFENVKSPLLKVASSIAMTHHEKWDGSGYPSGLTGEEIPIEGRITAVADVFDALRSERPYKRAFPIDKCLSILEEERGSHFDPRIVDAFFARKEQILAISETYDDAKSKGS